MTRETQPICSMPRRVLPESNPKNTRKMMNMKNPFIRNQIIPVKNRSGSLKRFQSKDLSLKRMMELIIIAAEAMIDVSPRYAEKKRNADVLPSNNEAMIGGNARAKMTISKIITDDLDIGRESDMFPGPVTGPR
jgi:hypothetical protein